MIDSISDLIYTVVDKGCTNVRFGRYGRGICICSSGKAFIFVRYIELTRIWYILQDYAGYVDGINLLRYYLADIKSVPDIVFIAVA